MPAAATPPELANSFEDRGMIVSIAPCAEKKARNVWIDIDNSPHVPFFLPIIEELRNHGVALTLTARNMYQVCELLDFFHLPCQVIGGHYGKNKLLKVLCNCVRAAQLTPRMAQSRPDLAVSHGSRAQILVSKLLRIPAIMLHDYEHSTKTGFLEPNWTLVPEVIPETAISRDPQRVLKYPGLKEDVYVPRFQPDRSIFSQLGISATKLLVTLRPPANEAHYHNPESDVLCAETIRFLSSRPHVHIVMLPRNFRQREQLRTQWTDLIAKGLLNIPDFPVDGLNLIWFSDLVISGGGTMNREAAALGTPVYSIFRGKIGAVDRYLAQQGRLVLLESIADVKSKIRLTPWERPARPDNSARPALQSIIRTILAILDAPHTTTRTVVKKAA